MNKKGGLIEFVWLMIGMILGFAWGFVLLK